MFDASLEPVYWTTNFGAEPNLESSFHKEDTGWDRKRQ